jgi:hypothetical protein
VQPAARLELSRAIEARFSNGNSKPAGRPHEKYFFRVTY